MRQDSWICRYLARHAFVVYHCNLCSEAYYSQVIFAAHLMREHMLRDQMLVRFVGSDSGWVKPIRPNRSRSSVQGPSASS